MKTKTKFHPTTVKVIALQEEIKIIREQLTVETIKKMNAVHNRKKFDESKLNKLHEKMKKSISAAQILTYGKERI